MIYFVIIGIFSVIGGIVSNKLKSKFQKYSQVNLKSGKSGAEIAKMMLSHYGINDVKIEMGQGFLSDHYNPMTKTVKLSPAVFQGRHISAAAVAAHECGHAVQHATAYNMLTFRSKMVPITQIATNAQRFVFMFAMGGMAMMGGMSGIIGLVILAAFGVPALFSLVTLPVEFDASNRALAWLDDTQNLVGEEYDGAKDALTWAAMTYVVAAISSLVVFLYFLLQFLGSRD